MPRPLKTPGVYIEEKNAFPGSVVEVATAIPAFIGYTEKADRNGRSLKGKPTRITSLIEFITLFGEGFHPMFEISTFEASENQESVPPNHSKHKVVLNDEEKAISFVEGRQFYLFNSLKFFFANGGSMCYIVSVGSYSDTPSKDDLIVGLEPLLKEQEPTMIVSPDAVVLGAESYDVYFEVLDHCKKMQNRIAILDVYDGYVDPMVDPKVIERFREKNMSPNPDYAAAYYPWLHTSVISKGELTFKNVKDWKSTLSALLSERGAKTLIEDFDAGSTDPSLTDEENAAALAKKEGELHLGLGAASPTYTQIMEELLEMVNLLPPSGAMAGVYTTVDNNRGVWQSPANVGINSVVKPAINISHDEQENLNVDAMTGKSVNAIRTFPGVGTLVWGGRTMDGNSLDWRYINVRRTMIMLEQSIQLALRAYVFEPNDANTWTTVRSMIVNFLTDKWKQGALAGTSPADAFDVQIGLGTTMTSVDILEGKMLVTIKLAITRPAEFIVFTLEQQMQKE